MSDRLRRRDFLRQVGAGVVGGAIGLRVLADDGAVVTELRAGALPLRRLGRIGIEVPVLGFGTAAMGHAFYRQEPFEEVTEAVIAAGIRYIDTAPIYDVAEQRLAPVLRRHRDKLFLVTKCWSKSREEALRSIEGSLERMQVDQVDLCHMHNVGQYTQEEALGKGGLLEGMLEAKKRGWIKHIGCTGHMNRDRFMPVIETGEIDLVMVAMNFVDRHTYNFEEVVLPVARKHDCAIVAMKVYGGVTRSWDGYRTRRPGRLAADDELRQMAVDYALSIEGLSACVIGVKTLNELKLTIEAVRNAQPLKGDRRDIVLARGKEIAQDWGDHFGTVTTPA